MTAPLLHLPDVSEYQPNVNWKQVVAHNGGAAIIRAYNGYRADHAWYGGTRRKAFWRAGGRALGIYAFLVADRGWLIQAHEFIALVGSLRPGEAVILDVESGAVDDRAVKAWRAFVASHLPGCTGAWVYSYPGFIASHGLTDQFGHRGWIAAYQATEPTAPGHDLWQHADSEVWPGIGACDCSIFHGNAADLARVFGAAAPAAAPTPKPVPHRTPPPVKKPPVKKPPVTKPAKPVVPSPTRPPAPPVAPVRHRPVVHTATDPTLTRLIWLLRRILAALRLYS